MVNTGRNENSNIINIKLNLKLQYHLLEDCRNMKV